MPPGPPSAQRHASRLGHLSLPRHPPVILTLRVRKKARTGWETAHPVGREPIFTRVPAGNGGVRRHHGHAPATGHSTDRSPTAVRMVGSVPNRLGKGQVQHLPSTHEEVLVGTRADPDLCGLPGATRRAPPADRVAR
ncbi:hypothetical protein NUM_36750 [Actinocatenispora comari]|uniref:Uncharacterized protein n=1 Tax=Actinocatenispora comari TaxID=2807577 RepID=A0A8J4AB90_9ACTN|nr:hypothetical protein NUM_36750 [Actinocatenispora comari]